MSARRKLIDGRIPAHTPCPYDRKCTMSCHHQGKSHTVPYSCGSARAFEILEERNEEKISKKHGNANAVRE